ncbi:MAG: right-handed parallel beta-helix repeat-containing protein [Propionibacteriaceae bacterium]|jgi:hypothetical protein|nr:right-handed parallel beta-helix repeat-containing protein [Propionibacteriaceae bacterium]
MTTQFTIREYGAVGDGVTNDAPAIQAAIDAAHANGGGTVIVPSGATYLAGSIVLKSNVELHVERGATLKASGRWEDITERHNVTALSSGTVHEDWEQSGIFLAAYEAENIAVTGAGTIDGNGQAYIARDLGPIYQMPINRPFALCFIGCRSVSLTESLYWDSALWTVRLTGCEDVLIHGLRIKADMLLPNADGIDLDHCRNVRISDCDIHTPDDAISLKTCDEFSQYGPCENITVTNCVLESKSSALVIGVDATAPIRNIVFNNCVILNSHRGLSVNLGQDSLYENILFSNIVVETRLYDDSWWGRGEPIYVSAFPWQEEIGRIRNVRFVNILARSESGVQVFAERPGLIEGVLLDNVRVEIDKWSDIDGGVIDRRPYAGDDDLITRDIPGFYIDQAADVTIRHCEVVWGPNHQEFWGADLEVHDAPGLVVEGSLGIDCQ